MPPANASVSAAQTPKIASGEGIIRRPAASASRKSGGCQTNIRRITAPNTRTNGPMVVITSCIGSFRPHVATMTSAVLKSSPADTTLDQDSSEQREIVDDLD